MEETSEFQDPIPASRDALECWIFENFGKYNKRSFICFKDNQGLAELIYSVCESLEQPPGVWHIGFDIFTKFIEERFTQYLKSSAETGILHQIQEHSFLQLVSSCQIASKLSSYSSHLGVYQCQTFLRKAGLEYAPKDISNSEIQVLTTLNYDVGGPSVYALIQTIIAALIANHTSNVVYSHILPKLQPIIVHLIDATYLHSYEIYLELYRTVTKQTSIQPNDRDGFRQLTSNRLQLAAAILCVAVYMVDASAVDAFLNVTHLITGIELEDLAEFANAIHNVILEI